MIAGTRSTTAAGRGPRAADRTRGRLLAVALAGLALPAMALVAAQGAAAAKRANGIIFEIRTDQGIAGRLTYLKRYEGQGRNFVQLEVEVLLGCAGDFGSYNERTNVILQGRTRGNGFSADFYPQNTPTDQFRHVASVRFGPSGRSGGLPRWRKATGTVRAMRAINDPFVQVRCDSGPVSFETTSSRRARFGPRPPFIVVV